MNSSFDRFLNVATPISLVFVGITVLMAIPRINHLATTMEAIHQDARHFADNPVPVALQTSEALANGILNVVGEKAVAASDTDLGKKATEATTNAVEAAGGLLNSLLKQSNSTSSPAEQSN